MSDSKKIMVQKAIRGQALVAYIFIMFYLAHVAQVYSEMLSIVIIYIAVKTSLTDSKLNRLIFGKNLEYL